MIKEEQQYIEDCLLIESLFRQEMGLVKKADITSILSSLVSPVYDAGKSEIEEHGYAAGLFNIMAPAIMWRAGGPLFGILYQIASEFFSIEDVFTKIMSFLAPKLKAGEQVTPSEVNNAGRAVAEQVVGETPFLSSESSTDLLFFLKTSSIIQDSRLEIIKEAAREKPSYWDQLVSDIGPKDPTKRNVPWLFSAKQTADGAKTSLIQRIFGNVFSAPKGQSKVLWIIVGIIIWFIKTLLAGAGLLAVSGAVKSFIKGKDEKEKAPSDKHGPTDENGIPSQQTAEAPKPQKMEYNLKTSGEGQKTFPNDKEYDWVVDLINGRVEDTLLYWIKQVYPFLQLTNEKLMSSQSFSRMVNLLEHGYESNSNQLVMPKGYNSWKQIVDAVVLPIVK